MLPDEVERVAARYVPGEGKLDIHRLGDGLVNATYRVLRAGRAYSMRVAALNPYALGLDRAWEARVLQGAVDAGLAPVQEYVDPQQGILIARWAEGRTWTPAEVRRRANISRMAGLLRRIHALPVPAPARVMNPQKWIEYYSAPLRSEPQGGLATALQAAATGRLSALAALPSVAAVVCHSDLHTLNLVDCGDSLVLLDWEYAHASDPLWDLAGWSANNDLEVEPRTDLLAAYVGRPPSPHEQLRLQLLIWLYDYVCLLWSRLYLSLGQNSRPDIAVQGEGAAGGVAARALELAARLNTSK